MREQGPHKERDPAARRRLTATIAAVVVVWPLLVLSEFRPGILFDAHNVETMRGFVGQFFPPATGREFTGLVAKATLETLAIATAGTALAVLLALPLSLVLSRSLSISRIGPGPGGRLGSAVRALARGTLLFLRGIPEIVWALLLVRAFGLGPSAAVFAIAFTYAGMLGKVYSEIMESGDTRPARALLEAGSGRGMAFLYGALPGSAQELASYTVYRFECAVRASVIMGFVGAGGIGQLMDQSMKMLNGGEVSTILVVFLLLVFLADGISVLFRRLLS